MTTDPYAIDYDRHPHVFVAGGTGSGVTTTLARLTAEGAANGADVTVIDVPGTGFRHLKDVPGIHVHDAGDAVEAIRRFIGEMELRLESGDATGPLRLLVIDRLEALAFRAHSDPELREAIRRLARVLDVGRTVRHHLLAEVGAASLRMLGTGARESAGTVIGLRLRSRKLSEQLRLPAGGPRRGLAQVRQGTVIDDVAAAPPLRPERIEQLVGLLRNKAA